MVSRLMVACLAAPKVATSRKGQFYLVAAVAIAIIILPILISKYNISYARIEESPQRIRTNINGVLKSMDIWVNQSEQKLLGRNKDVLLALATSGGLGVNIEDIINASKLFLDCANETDRVSLYRFPYCPSKTGACNCNTSQLTGYMYLSDENKVYMRNIINGFEKFGKSPIRRTVEDSKSIVTTQADPVRNRIEILLATGPENCEGDPCTEAESFPRGIPIYTVGFKIGASGEAQLRCIAQKTGGKYFYAATGSDLMDIFCSLGKGWETEITDFLYFVKAAISERLLNISFDVSYATSLSTEMSAGGTEVRVSYTVNDESHSLSDSFHYSLYENSTLVSSGTEPISIAVGELYKKTLYATKHSGSNYTSISYIGSDSERLITNEMTLPYYSSFSMLTVKNIEVSYNVSTDSTFVTDKITVPMHIIGDI